MARITSLVAALFGCVVQCLAYQQRSIVIVPGILGNQIQAKLDKSSSPHFWCPKKRDWYTLWLGVLELVPGYVECFADNIQLQYNETTGKFSDKPGVQTRIPDFGGTSSIEYLDPDTKWFEPTQYFADMVDYFVNNHGYIRGKTILGAPYDWRFAPDDYMVQGYYKGLQKLIETAYANGNNTPVTLLAHSMGAPTTLYFLTKVVNNTWKEKYIKVYVTLSGVWRGAAKSAKAFASGDNEGIIIDKDIWGRSSQRTYPSTAWLLPYPSDTWTKEDILIITPERNYSAWDYQAFFDRMGYPRGYQMFETTEVLTGALPPPNITTYCYYGIDMDTPLRFKYGEGGFPDTDPDTEYGDGDGTVNVNSLTACERWKQQQPYPVTLQEFKKVEHVAMIKNSDVIAAVAKLALA